MNRREALVGAIAVALAAPAIAQNSKTGCDIGPQTLNAAGTLLLLAVAEHGAVEGTIKAFAALAQQASAGCSNG